jgi:hypothetical protein
MHSKLAPMVVRFLQLNIFCRYLDLNVLMQAYANTFHDFTLLVALF